MANQIVTGFKAYDDLNFTDDFMFGKVMEDLELCHDVLEVLLQRKIEKLVDTSLQKEFKSTSDGKPIRMDVYSHNENEVFDSEIQNLNNKSIESLELPKRSRFYQSSIDTDYMKKGYSYKQLPESTILFICTFDPFNKGLGKYTFYEKCEEHDGIYLNDGATKVYYNCAYTGSNLPDDLMKLYEYINTGKSCDVLTERINEAVIKAKSIEEWRSAYMKEMVLLMDAKEEGREEERQNTEAERRRADAATKKADAAAKRADNAEARIRELEAELAAIAGSRV